MRAILRAIRRRIALKLTLTLVGFVAVTSLAAGLYLDHALAQFASESLAARLASSGAVLQDEARDVLEREAGRSSAPAFVARVSRPTGARVTLVAADGRVVGESERSASDLDFMDNHNDRPEVKAALGG